MATLGPFVCVVVQRKGSVDHRQDQARLFAEHPVGREAACGFEAPLDRVIHWKRGQPTLDFSRMVHCTNRPAHS